MKPRELTPRQVKAIVDPLATISQGHVSQFETSHIQRVPFSYQSHIPTTYPRGTEWQEQLFRLVKLAPKRVGG